MSMELDKQVQNTTPLAGGTTETRKYYDEEGWTKMENGHLADNIRWRPLECGPLQSLSQQLSLQRFRQALAQAGDSLNLLECGCGGNPELGILDLCSHYTGADFSSTGLKAADEKLREQNIPYKLFETDFCCMPFADESFDAVYSAHAIYHIRDPKGQATAFREILRVTKKDGVVVLILSNPHPLLFPIRLVQRLIADIPIVGDLLYSIKNKLRQKTPIPYNPRPLGWMRRQLEPFGQVEIIGSQMASVWFNNHVTENWWPGRLVWKTLVWLEQRHPQASARLGNYIQITVRKSG